MKKILTAVAAALIVATPAANAQALLNKLKDKANEAINSAVAEKIGEKINDVADKVETTVAEKTGADFSSGTAVKSAGKSAADGLPVPDSRQTLQPKRSSSFGWSGVVTPSKAEYPIPLMNEFPAVPSPAQLANPTEAEQIAYYNAIKAVTLRAEELNADTTCEDNFTEQWRAEAEKALQEAYGLTPAEMEALKSGSLSPAEEEKLVEKMRAKMLGDYDEEKLMAEAKKAEGMTQQDIENSAVAASCAVFDKYDSQLRKYCGCTAEEYKKATRESMSSGDNAASRAIEKKSEDYMKTLDPATKKEAEAFMSTLKKELTKAAMGAVPGAGYSLQMAKNMADFQKSLSPLMEKYMKIEKYAQDIAEAWPYATWSDASAKFSESERKKLESIKASIYASSNPAEYDALYLQAGEMIKTYRERAAKVWTEDVQKRYNKVKDGMGDIIKIQRQAIADGIIPECALWRVPLNLVIEAGDVLAGAYLDFPSNYPHMYSEEVVRQIPLQKGEASWWPEFYVASDLDAILAGRNIFKESNGNIYQFDKGSWHVVPQDYGKDMVAGDRKPVSASWKSSDGKREVIFNAEGGFLQFPEGDIVYPVAWDKRGNDIVWAENQIVENQDGTLSYKVVKCTYKL